MNEVFIEQIIKKKITLGGIVLRMLGILLVAVGLFTVYLFGILGMTITALLIYLTYNIFLNTSIEYEYSLLNSDLTVDKIIGQNRRKHVAEFDLKQAEIIAPAYSDEILNQVNGVKTIDCSSGYKNENRYSMILYHDKERIQVLFDPNENIIEGMYALRPSIVKKS